MKGIVFTEFMDMMEDVLPVEAADRVLQAAALPHGGAYTAVGTYDHHEMLRLVTALSTETGTPVPELVRAFGRHLFGRFTALYPGLFAGIADTRGFCRRLDGYIHVEVRKLYPDAELPRFLVAEGDGGELRMTYRSTRPFADLAHGLFEGCGAHFGERLSVTRELVPGDEAAVVFVLSWA